MYEKRKFPKGSYMRNDPKGVSANIHYEFHIKGAVPSRRQGSTGTAVLREARLFIENLRWKIFNELQQKPEKRALPTLEEIRTYELKRATDANASERQIEAIANHFHNLFKFFKKIEDVTQEGLEDYVRYRRKCKGKGGTISDNTIQREMRSLRSGWVEGKWDKSGKCKNLPWGEIRWPGKQFMLTNDAVHPTSSVRAYTQQDLNDLARLLDSVSLERQIPMVLAMLTGMRRAEIDRCDKTHLVYDHGIWMVRVPERKKRNSKRKTDRLVALTPAAKRMYDYITPDAQCEHRTFFSAECRRMGFEKWSKSPPHMRDMRGLFETIAIETNNQSRVIDMAMSHDKGTPDKYGKQMVASLALMAQRVEAFWRPRLSVFTRNDF